MVTGSLPLTRASRWIEIQPSHGVRALAADLPGPALSILPYRGCLIDVRWLRTSRPSW